MILSPENLPEKLLSIIIISYNTQSILRECLHRVAACGQGMDLETIVVENASSDGSADMIRREFPEVRLIVSDRNLGFAGGNNLGLKAASGRFLLLLNSDAYLLPGVLESTIQFMEKTPRCGILGVKLVGEDGQRQPCARMLPNAWLKFLVISGIAARFPRSRLLGGPDYPWWDHGEPKEVGWVPGAYFLIRRGVLNSVGLMDDRYFLYFEETDYCLQARRMGWQVMFYPEASVIHLGGESSKTTEKRMSCEGKQLIEYQLQSEFRYYRKNFGLTHVLASAGVEVFWNLIVIIKNTIGYERFSRQKIRTSKLMISEIYRTLLKDRFGKGAKADFSH